MPSVSIVRVVRNWRNSGVRSRLPLGGLRLLAVVLWSAGWWLAAFLLFFLLLPGLSALPLYLGAVTGSVFFVLQFIFGASLLKVLLGIDKLAPDEKVAWVPGDCPFIFVLDGVVVATKAVRKFEAEDLETWGQLLREYWRGGAGWIYASLLALPCLMRAAEAIALDYGRLRFSQGPLWYLGRTLGLVAIYLEKPLRWGRGAGCNVKPEIRRELEASLFLPLVESQMVPTWMACLDVLSLVDFRAAKRMAVWRWGGGQGQPPGEVVPVIAAWVPWFISGIMAVWAWFGGLWGAPALFLGLGYIVKINGEYANCQAHQDVVEWADGWLYKYEPVKLHGLVAKKDTPGLDDTWIAITENHASHVQEPLQAVEPVQKVESSHVTEAALSSIEISPAIEASPEPESPQVNEPPAVGDQKKGNDASPKPSANQAFIRLDNFVGWQVQEGQEICVEGWLNSENLSVTVGKLMAKSKVYRYYPRLRRLVLPWFLVCAGFLWCLLQRVGL